MNQKRERGLPLSTVHVVAAYCGEYIRMKEALSEDNLSHPLTISYTAITTILYEETAAALHLVGCQVEEMLIDIAKNRGYRSSALCGIIGRGRYNRAKARAVRRIAERMLLCDE